MERAPSDDAAVRKIRYVSKRMKIANERMLSGTTIRERIRAGRWVVAWALAAGALAPPYLAMRSRGAPVRPRQ